VGAGEGPEAEMDYAGPDDSVLEGCPVFAFAGKGGSA
jgi:hypothetical protein